MHALMLLALLTAQPPGTPVTPAMADVSPLGEALRLEPVSYLVESDFSRVYEIEPTPGLFGREGTRRFARRAGAVTAIFPRAAYAETAQGPVALIPADTVFVIGPLPETRPVDTEAASVLAADLRATPSTMAKRRAPQGPASRAVSIWTDAAYRDARLGAILDAAAEGR